MNDQASYELLDFGGGRKLERFGEVTVDRPDLAAANAPAVGTPHWAESTARFERENKKNVTARGTWSLRGEISEPWICAAGAARFELKLTDFGHVGMFPEQASCWRWIGEQATACKHSGDAENTVRVLNLFAHTGGSTLAAAAAGASVVHVDSARNVVDWARRNAALSNLEDASVRWIVEDALKFARRELKRGNRYAGIVLDPPGYGHGPTGETWTIDRHLPELLGICSQLLDEEPRFLLLTCHAPEYDAAKLAELIDEAGMRAKCRSPKIETGGLWLSTADGRNLPAGLFARLAAER
jgi:23S rRNA (cytosine1962-C5)-methyltransferase